MKKIIYSFLAILLILLISMFFSDKNVTIEIPVSNNVAKELLNSESEKIGKRYTYNKNENIVYITLPRSVINNEKENIKNTTLDKINDYVYMNIVNNIEFDKNFDYIKYDFTSKANEIEMYEVIISIYVLSTLYQALDGVFIEGNNTHIEIFIDGVFYKDGVISDVISAVE